MKEGTGMKKTIGILGGMGPLATVDLFEKVVKKTPASADQDHFRIFIDNNPAIPDRTAALLHGGEDPVPEMTSALRNLEAMGAGCILMPCNTAHCFLPALQALTPVPILNMPEITAAHCAALYGEKRACLLATDGTLETGLYDKVLTENGVPFIVPEREEQKLLMYLIYDVVKASRPLQGEREHWRTVLDAQRQRGAEYFILACTELPILADTLDVPGPFVDPTEELAAAAVRFCSE